jgi:hypothetical protein
MSEQRGAQPDSAGVERVEGAVIVFTPCHGARVLFPPEQAVPDEALRVVCPRDGVECTSSWSLTKPWRVGCARSGQTRSRSGDGATD